MVVGIKQLADGRAHIQRPSQMKMGRAGFFVLTLFWVIFASTVPARADDDQPCLFASSCTDVSIGNGSVGVAAASVSDSNAQGLRHASDKAPKIPKYVWRLQTPCQVSDSTIGACFANQPTCEQVEGRSISYYVVQRRALAQPLNDEGNQPAVDGQATAAVLDAGTPYGPWLPDGPRVWMSPISTMPHLRRRRCSATSNASRCPS